MEKIEKEWQENDNTASITDALFTYLRHWKWFVLSLLISITCGLCFVMVSQKQYKSSLSVLLNEDKGSSGSKTGELNLDAMGLFSTTSNIDNEIAILTSPDLMEYVVDSLNLQASYFIKKKLRKTEIYDEAPFHISYKSIDQDLLRNISLIVEKQGLSYSILGVYLKSDGTESDIEVSVDKLPSTVKLPNDGGSLLISLTGKKVEDGDKYYVTIANKSSTKRTLSASLNISPTTKSSSVLSLSLLVANKEKGASILKALVRKYNEMNIFVNNEMAYNTSLFINERLKEIAVELGDVENDVVDYKQKNQIVDLGSEAQLFIQQTGQNQQRLMDVETQLNVISLVDRYVNDPSNNFRIIPNLGISDPALAQVITEYNNKVLSSDALLKNTGEENPMRIRLTDEINNMRSSISNSLKNVKQSYQIAKRDLQKLSGSTQSNIQSIPKQEKGLVEKIRQQQIKETLFLFLMQKREETNLSIASTSDKARIIASPQLDSEAIAPKSQVVMLASSMLGLLIPIAVIYVFNLFKTQIISRSELEKLSKVSVIGQICRNETKDNIVIENETNPAIVEMFKSLRNNLSFALKQQDNQVILVTSTISGEGKTFVAINLAATFALSNKKVLVIGADVRNPKLKKYIKSGSKKGLTDFLIDSSTSWQSYINKSDISPNLDVMMSGTIPPNPNELLMSPKLKNFLLQAKIDYDFVIIDTAPVGLVSDTYLLNEYGDITLYVIRQNVTPKAAINYVNQQKQENRLNNMYLVLNDASLDNRYEYGYGKGYGYATR
ncbi:MAG: hypothetical protein RL662_1546 [Bacteroidota bacterium]|jgi:capsular exopolysaccharide synthesis family protein